MSSARKGAQGTEEHSRAIWPTAVGIVSAIIAVWTTGFNVRQWVVSVDTRPDWFTDQWWGAFVTVVSVLGILLGAFLFFAGVQTVRRRAKAQKLHLIYVVLALLYFVGGWIAVLVISLGWSRRDLQDNGTFLMATFTLPVQLIYPLLVWLWFQRDSVEEQVGQWRRETS